MACGLSVFKSPVIRVPLSLYHGELLSAEIRQVFWLASHPPGAFPTLRPVAFMPFVIAYSGGSAGESLLLETHPSSLSSP